MLSGLNLIDALDESALLERACERLSPDELRELADEYRVWPDTYVGNGLRLVAALKKAQEALRDAKEALE